MRLVSSNELALTKVCFEIERRGILIDRPFIERALHHEHQESFEAKRDFEKVTGRAFKDSSKLFAEIYDSRGEPYPRTAQGNPSFPKDFLESANTPTTQLIRRIKESEKRAGTYYSSFLHYADANNRVHANIRQAGTTTGRFAYSNPNLQNLPRQEKEGGEFIVRRSFTPPKGFYLASVDYSQVEYRLMLDYAGEKQVIDAVMAGEDLHQTNADIVGISRTFAKTLAFAILYGAGAAKIAWMLGISIKEAQDLKRKFLSRLPKVGRFIKRVMDTGEARGYVYNWMGRRCNIRFKSEAYKLPNHLIQGGAADVIKVAMNQIHELLKETRSGMVLQVHDDVVSEIHENELDLIPKIKQIMESVYKPKNGMYLTVDPQVSLKSLAKQDMVEFAC